MSASNSLEIAVPVAGPRGGLSPLPGYTPGGILTPCAIKGTTFIKGTQSRLDFQAPQGSLLEVHRVQVSLPVFMETLNFEKLESASEEVTEYKTEAEALEVFDGLGGKLETLSKTEAPTYNTPYTKTEETFTYNVEGKHFKTKGVIQIERSILPITLGVVIAILGPDGTLWSSTFDIDMHHILVAEGETEYAAGFLNGYADLTNPLVLTPDRQVYSLQIYIFVPAAIETIPALGLELKNGEVHEGNGAITIFYDEQPTDLSK